MVIDELTWSKTNYLFIIQHILSTASVQDLFIHRLEIYIVTCFIAAIIACNSDGNVHEHIPTEEEKKGKKSQIKMIKLKIT